LHYEVLADNNQVNPMTLELLPRRILTDEELTRFRKAADGLMSTMAPTASEIDVRRAAGNAGAIGNDG
jgi:hypothetical protein